MYKLFLFLVSIPVFAQTNATIQYVTTAPSGSCSARANLRLRTPNGTLYSCQSGTWGLISGGGGAGDVVGPASATDDAVVVYNGTTGKLVQNSACTIATGVLTCTGFIGGNGAASGADYYQGLTSGGVALAAADVAGTAIVYVLPSTNGTSGQVLIDGGATTCPTLAAGFPATCHLLVWDTLTLASADFANQGTITTVLHGNAAGNPSWASVVSADLNITTSTCTNQFLTAISATGTGTCTTNTLAGAQHANQGTTSTVLHGNAAGNPSWGSVALSELATQAADTVVINATGGAAVPTAVAMPTGGTNGCAGTSNALTYNTTSHAWGCNTISAGGGVPTLAFSGVSILDRFTPVANAGDGASPQTAYASWIIRNIAGSGSITSTTASSTAMGIWTLSSGATANNDTAMEAYTQGAGDIFPGLGATIYTYQARFALGSAADSVYSVCLSAQQGFAATCTGNTGIWCDVTNTASAGNWACHTRTGGVTTDVTLSPTQTADTSYHVIKITVVTGTVTFYFDGTSVGTSSTNLPTAQLSPKFEAKTTTSSAKTMLLNAWSFNN